MLICAYYNSVDGRHIILINVVAQYAVWKALLSSSTVVKTYTVQTKDKYESMMYVIYSIGSLALYKTGNHIYSN